MVYRYPQQTVECIDVYTDTDWAGCPRTRKSTSGGGIMLGQHATKHWSSTQTSVALSSGEAEFAGVIRGAGQGLGYQALLRDLGVDLPLRVWTDSSAAIGICSRQGLGKLRHLDTHTLWIQQAVRTGKVDLRKVAGELNPADLLTKHSLSRARVEMLSELFGCRFLGGRSESAPALRRGDSTKNTMGTAFEQSLVTRLPPLTTSSSDLCAAGTSLNALADHGDPSGHSGTGESENPFMPHLRYSEPELLRLYPRMEAPDEVLAEDLSNDSKDGIYQAGLRIVQEIQAASETHGRLRHARTAQAGALEETPLSTTHTSEAARSVVGGVFGVDAGASFGPASSECFSNVAVSHSSTSLPFR